MYDFHYKFLKTRYETNVKLLCTDTDCFIYSIQTEAIHMNNTCVAFKKPIIIGMGLLDIFKEGINV